MIRTALAMSGLAGLVVAFFAVFGGMALVTGTGVIIESGLRSPLTGQRLTGADVLVSRPQTVRAPEDLPVALPERAVVPAALAGDLAELPGVAAAVSDLSFPAALLTGPAAVPVSGHGWSSAALARQSGPALQGRAPQGPRELAVSADLGVRQGATVEVVAGGSRGAYRVTGLVSAPGVYFADDAAAGLAGRTSGPRAGTTDLIALRAAPGTSAEALATAVRARVGDGYVVSTGTAKGDAESPGTAAARTLLIALPSSIGGISLIIVGFVVGGGISLSTTRQRRDLALLRAAGATPRQVRRLVAVQGTVAALAALPFGAAAGYVLAGRLGDLLVHVQMLPERLPLTYSPLPALGAALLLLGVVRLAAWAASRGPSRMPATAAVRDSQSEPRTPSKARFVIGLVIIAGAFGLSALPLFLRQEFAAIGPTMAALLSVVGLALAGPRLVQFATGVLGRVLPRRTPAPVWLAVSNTHGYALRTAGAVAALGMVVTLTTSMSLTHTTVMRATDEESSKIITADAVVTLPAAGGLPAELLADLKATPGVRAVTTMGTTTVISEDLVLGDGSETLTSRSAAVLGPDAGALVDLGVTGGSLRDLKGATIALDADPSQVGRHRNLILGDGTKVKARIAATYDRALGLGPVVLARDLVAGHTTTGLPATALVKLDDSASLDRVAARWPGLEIASGAVSPRAAENSAQLWINLAVLAVLLGYVLVSVANRLVATTAARGPELAAIRRLGATPRQLKSMIRWEALLLALTAAVIGLALSAVPLMALSLGFLGRPLPAGPLWLAPASAAAVCVVVWLALDLTARRLIRRT
ncbi:FtsX-like permease family protein [Nonomuraea sp. NPDC050310]|uniref:FtsX-like permease family protein n=1 Tax=Nonomuraea sp. NPDC050310 TaxID=3154935 RepID=UPI0033DB1473